MEYIIEDKDTQITTTGTGDKTSLGSLEAVLPVPGSSAAVLLSMVFQQLSLLSKVLHLSLLSRILLLLLLLCI